MSSDEFAYVDFEWYDRLRSSLEDLRQQFLELAAPGISLNHAIFIAEPDDVNSDSWAAFIHANRGQVFPEGWEHWEVSPDGNDCGCFFGEGALLPLFRNLASSSYLVLREIHAQASKGWPVPEGYRLTLPPNDEHFEWLRVVHRTSDVNTPLLRTDLSVWKLPEGRQGWDDLQEGEMWEHLPDGRRYFAHPLMGKLRFNVFRSSAEAIRCWLFPEEIVTVGGKLDYSPIALPSVNGGEADYEESEEPYEDESEAGEDGSENNDGSGKPRWDGWRLWGGGVVIREYARPAEHQKTLLDAFEAANWDEKLADPFGIKEKERKETEGRLNPTSSMEYWKKQRRDAVNRLNREQDRINFRCIGDGYGVAWRWKSGSDDPLPDSAASDAE